MRRGIYNAEPKHYSCACIVIGNVLTKFKHNYFKFVEPI